MSDSENEPGLTVIAQHAMVSMKEFVVEVLKVGCLRFTMDLDNGNSFFPLFNDNLLRTVENTLTSGDA